MNRKIIERIDRAAAVCNRESGAIAVDAADRESLDMIIAYLNRVHPRTRWVLGRRSRAVLAGRIDIEL